MSKRKAKKTKGKGGGSKRKSAKSKAKPKPAEEPKADKPAEEPKAEAKPAEEPKAEAKPAEEPKPEQPKAEAKPADEPKPEEPKAEAKPADEPKAEAKPAEEPKAEAKPAEEPKAEAKPAEEPKAEAKPAEEPKAEAKPAEEPKAEAKPAEEPKDEAKLPKAEAEKPDAKAEAAIEEATTRRREAVVPGEAAPVPKASAPARTLEPTKERAAVEGRERSILGALLHRFPAAEGKVLGEVTHQGELYVTVERDALLEVLAYLRDEPALRFRMFVDLTCADYLKLPELAPKRFGLLYVLYSFELDAYVRLRVYLDLEDLAVDSATPVFRGANWAEREVYDLYGVAFRGHPDPQRILLPDYYTGHPLRKDYPLKGRGERDSFPVISRAES